MANIDSFSYWMKQIANRSEGTKTQYKRYFKKFAEWMNKTPNELIEIQKQAKTNQDDRREQQILEGKVKAYINHLEKQGRSISTQKVVYGSILSFFTNNLYPLDMTSQDRPSGEARGSRIPEKSEVLKMLHAAKSQKYRAAILLLKDSGLRVSDAVKLRWLDIKDFGEGFWGWRLQTQKRKVQATPFVGPETTAALKQLKRNDDRIFGISTHTLSNALSLIIQEARLEDVSAHGLRKYFNVEMQAARIPREWRYQMMGKKTGAYDENRLSKLFEAYREAYDHLRVYGANVNVQVEKLESDMEMLRMDNRTLRERLNGYELKQDQIEFLMRRIEVLEKLAKK